MPEADTYEDGYDESAILTQYRADVNDRIILSTKYSLPVMIAVVGGYFTYSDFFIRDIPFVFPWRLPAIVFPAVFLVLRRSRFNTNVTGMFVAYNMVVMSIGLMLAGITWSLFDTEFFDAAINGTLVAIFGAYAGTYGGIRILAANYAPILIMVAAIYLYHRPPLPVMAEFGNVVFLIAVCFSVSQVQENLRFREFRSRKIAEIEEERSKDALLQLRAAQQQLVQAEKLASLGELTAGIAHEIKNPLNFINNFAALNAELAEEVREALADGDSVEDVLDDLKLNAETIASHGQRADSIVESMMRHASGTMGIHEETDLNVLAREAVDMVSFTTGAMPVEGLEIETSLDPELSPVQVDRQQVHRVLVNLLSNAVHAVRDVETPRIELRTVSVEHQVEVRVTDNGPGVPEAIREKIFEPFFTTKGPEEGTGLGLSLSYDICTQQHGGSLTVESTPAVGTTFVVRLPVRPATRIPEVGNPLISQGGMET